MTHDEMLASIEKMMNHDAIFMKDALRAVVELHRPCVLNWICLECSIAYLANFGAKPVLYPCPTIQAIEKELG
jgi:hypothetical protein